jgi:hypothetical protein
MADVLPFKQKPVKGTQKRQMPDDPHFFCKACDGNQFRIYADLRIYCVGCCSVIRLEKGIA